MIYTEKFLLITTSKSVLAEKKSFYIIIDSLKKNIGTYLSTANDMTDMLPLLLLFTRNCKFEMLILIGSKHPFHPNSYVAPKVKSLLNPLP